MFSTHGIPEEVKSDNAPPFQSTDFKRFAEHSGFEHRKITPEWPQANSKAERFMRTLEKAVHCAMIEGKGCKQEMYRFLRSYRATPHSSTGVPLATALFNRSIRTTLPEIKIPLFDKTMRETDAAAKFRMKQYADRRTNAKPSNLQPGDTVLVKQRRVNKNSTPYKLTAYEVVARKGTMITAKNDDLTITRNISRYKPVEIKMEPSVLPTEDNSLEAQQVNGHVT